MVIVQIDQLAHDPHECGAVFVVERSHAFVLRDINHLLQPGQHAPSGRSYVQQLEAIIEEGIQSKQLKPIIPYVAVLTILSAVRGLEFWHRSRKKLTPEEIEENMVLHLISGLKK